MGDVILAREIIADASRPCRRSVVLLDLSLLQVADLGLHIDVLRS